MYAIMFLYAAVLFFLLTPKVLVSLPAKANKYIVAGVHALIFALILSLTQHWVWVHTHTIFEGATIMMPDSLLNKNNENEIINQNKLINEVTELLKKPHSSTITMKLPSQDYDTMVRELIKKTPSQGLEYLHHDHPSLYKELVIDIKKEFMKNVRKTLEKHKDDPKLELKENTPAYTEFSKHIGDVFGVDSKTNIGESFEKRTRNAWEFTKSHRPMLYKFMVEDLEQKIPGSPVSTNTVGPVAPLKLPTITVAPTTGIPYKPH